MIDLEFHTTDPDDIELCRRYWQMDGDGVFKESEKALRPPSGTDARSWDIARVLMLSVTARDTRRRSPTCGAAKVVLRRSMVLAPMSAPTTCKECIELKRWLVNEYGPRPTPQYSGLNFESGGLAYPVAALALLDALGQIIDPSKLRNGFTVHDCKGLAPAHLGRLLVMLLAARVIERIGSPAFSWTMATTGIYRVVNYPTFEHDFAHFKVLLANGKNFNHNGLWDLWLNYAVSECAAFIAAEAIPLGLPTVPEEEELCTALRTAVSTFSIAEVRSMSRLAVREAAGLNEHGYTIGHAVSTIPCNISRLCKAASEGHWQPNPVAIPHNEPRSRLSEWFYRWFDIYMHARGSVVAGAFRGPRDA